MRKYKYIEKTGDHRQLYRKPAILQAGFPLTGKYPQILQQGWAQRLQPVCSGCRGSIEAYYIK